MLVRKNSSEVLALIKKDYPEFNMEEMLEFAKWDVAKIYNEAIENKLENYSTYLTNKIKDNKEKYRITQDIDHISVQYVELNDYYCNENNHIKIYMSIFFYDNTSNNTKFNEGIDKYWNDIWIVTYKNKTIKECENCGASLKYDKATNMYTCEYCRSTKINSRCGLEWKMEDIETIQ